MDTEQDQTQAQVDLQKFNITFVIFVILTSWAQIGHPDYISQRPMSEWFQLHVVESPYSTVLSS